MRMNLRANATITPKTRACIQASTASVAELAVELGVNETTVRRWRGRTTAADTSSRPKTIKTSLTAVEETLVCELRNKLDLPLDATCRRCSGARATPSSPSTAPPAMSIWRSTAAATPLPRPAS